MKFTGIYKGFCPEHELARSLQEPLEVNLGNIIHVISSSLNISWEIIRVYTRCDIPVTRNRLIPSEYFQDVLLALLQKDSVHQGLLCIIYYIYCTGAFHIMPDLFIGI